MSTFKHAFRIAALTAVPMALLHAAPALTQVTRSVEVLAIVEYPAFDAVRGGVEEQLRAEGFGVGRNLKWEYQSTQGNTATTIQIAHRSIGDEPGVIVTIAVPSAQAVVTATKPIPIVYSDMIDPVAMQLAKSRAPAGTNVIGVLDKLPLGRRVTLTKRMVPNAKRIGMVYDPDEVNSVVVITELKKLLSAQGMTLVESIAPHTMDVAPTAESLIGKVDVIYTNTDNNVMSACESLVKVADEVKILLVTGGTDSVKCDAIAAPGINYYELGQQTGKVIARILKGEKPDAIALAGSSNLELFISESAAKKQDATLSADLLKDAKEVIK